MSILVWEKQRSQLRRIFNRHATLIGKSDVIEDADLEFLQTKAYELSRLDEKIQDVMVQDSECKEESLDNEYDESQKYQLEWLKIKNHKKALNATLRQDQRQTRLPQIQLRKFDDNPRSWIPFWTQYKKIHEDDSIPEEDKCSYLLTCMTDDSKAKALVESYPPTKENYKKMVDTLKTRFAKDELLVEIYVREILALVLSKNNISIENIFDKISVNLQILESLGFGRDKYECILLPLIESSLPDSLLVQWTKTPLKQGSKLEQLLSFMENEIEAQGRCSLAKSFDNNIQTIPTAACLTSSDRNVVKEGKVICYFCDKSHNTLECRKANGLTLEEKKDAIKKKGGCYICLKKGHFAKNCKAFIKCMCCSKRHVIILCPTLHAPTKTGEQKIEDNRETSSNFTSNNVTTLLQTLVIKISKDKQQRKVRALLDSGSQRTYIKKALAEELGLEVTGSECLGHALFGGVKKPTQTHKIFRFNVSSLDDKYHTTMTALEQDVLCGSLPKVQNSKLIQDLNKYKISLTDTEENIEDISILIGSDQLGFIIKENFIRLNESLVAIPTKLGWTLQGPIQGVYNTTVSSNFVSELLEEAPEYLWAIELLGINDPYEKQDKTEILNSFNECISVNGEGRYEMSLMWKGDPDLSSNYEQARRRLMSTTKKLESIQKMEGYDEVIKDWVKEGIIEVVEKDNIREGHYLPHHAVIKMESATTKIRPVFDASCKDENKRSLNSCIEKGPCLIEEIPKLLLNFRAGVFGLISDIKKAFLQISIAPQDRKYLKLLWWKDVDKKEGELVTYQHARVPFGVTCSPFMLAVTIYHHIRKEKDNYKNTAKVLRDSFYVDNCVTSFDTPQEVEVFIEEATELMNKGKFELRGWMTNSAHNVDPVSVLGLQCNRHTDDLCCSINVKAVPGKITKRVLLSITQQIFDPIGFLSPVTLVPKIITQKVWMLKTGWDEEISAELRSEYTEWIKDIDCINQCKIPRRLSEKLLRECDVTIHVFSDASKDAYAGCIFLRTEYKEEVNVRLVLAKSRVTPIKRQMTLPRLELMGALIASRLYKEFTNSGALSTCTSYKTYCWTDSSVVYAWLQREEAWGVFVTNRVKEICKNTKKEWWNHLPGNYNPSDLPSRGCNPKTLIEKSWWTGPEWLYLQEEYWPRSKVFIKKTEEEEIIASESSKDITVYVESNTNIFSSKLLYFGKYRKIVRLVARLLRMSPRIRQKYNTYNITYEEYKNAEETIIKIVQKETYTGKIKNKKLLTIEIDGIIRVKTRLTYSGEDRDFIYPILLPGKNELVYRMVQQIHIDLQHAGTQTMMVEVRNTYWITGIRRLLKKVVAECKVCKRFKTKHYEAPTPPLPVERLVATAPFEVTGTDLAGPLILKNNSKCWIVLYTCAVYRAIHLELTDTLSTAGFITTLRRFISRRGRPRIIYTDNGTNFVGTANLLKEVNWKDVEEESNCYKIQWRFSAPAAPWWGGWWERLVRVVKDMLRRILGRASVDWIELSTILCDCEAVINSRPLTYVEMGDIRPLTPMMFLHGLSSNTTEDLDQIDHKNLNIRYKYVQKLREDFRIRFRNEYLSLLINKGKETKVEPKVGDVVLLQTETSNRLHWPICIVKEIYTGKDGHTRAARVKTRSGEKVRPYQRLFPLEISAVSREWLDKLPEESPGTADSGNNYHKYDQRPINTITRSGRVVKTPFRFLD